mgnify:CR=1 FL=1
MKVFKNLLLLVLIVFTVYNIFTGNSIRTDVALYDHKVDSIQKIIDSVEKINDSLNSHISHVDNEINQVQGQITSVNKNITVIKTVTHEKTNAVNDYTIHDLFKFFSDRYQDGLNKNGFDSTVKDTSGKTSH